MVHINAKGFSHSIHFHYIHFSDRFCSTFSLLSLSRIKHTLTYIFIYLYYDFPSPDTYSHAGGAYGDITPCGHFRFRELGGNFNKALQAAWSPTSCTKPCKLHKALQVVQSPASCTKPYKLCKALPAQQDQITPVPAHHRESTSPTVDRLINSDGKKIREWIMLLLNNQMWWKLKMRQIRKLILCLIQRGRRIENSGLVLDDGLEKYDNKWANKT